MKINGVIFDMDGLIFNTEKYLLKFWIEAAAFYGFDMQKEHILGIRSLSPKYAEPKLKGIFGDSFDFHTIRQKRIELMNSYIAENGVEKKPGIDELLDFLDAQGIKRAIATATDYPRTKEYLYSAKITDRFDEIVCGNMIKNGKPEPDIYITAAKALNLPPEECLALEDSPNGILSAYRAGCVPVMIPDLSMPDEESKKIFFTWKSSLNEVIDLISEINNKNR